jgi:hypothetical protein
MMDGNFPAKLELALKVCSISRGRLAAILGVDKSVVSRWLSGANSPSNHNLSGLTTLVAARAPGFTMLDWEGDIAHVATRMGLDAASDPVLAPPVPTGLDGWFPESWVKEAVATTALRGAAYEGFWRSTRLANDAPGRFVHDEILIRPAHNGLLRLRLGVVDMRFEGWCLPIQTQLFCFGVDGPSGVAIFAIFNAVLRHRAEVLDGLTLTLTRNAGGTPVTAAAIIERTGVLSGDAAADDARFEASIAANPLAPEGSIPDQIRDHLFRDIGPTAFAQGGEALMTMAFTRSLSRGPLSEGDLARRRAG